MKFYEPWKAATASDLNAAADDPGMWGGHCMPSFKFAPVIEFVAPGGVVLSIDVDNGRGTVSLGPGATWEEAAKLFWNAVASVVGQPPLFPDPPAAPDRHAGIHRAMRFGI